MLCVYSSRGYRNSTLGSRTCASRSSGIEIPSPIRSRCSSPLSSASPRRPPALFDFLDAIEPKGGGKTPQENALEALVLAMRSDWTNERLSRQIILLFADADPLLPEECGVRPEGMHRSVAELYRWWNTGLPEAGSSFDPRKARLIIAMNDADQSHSRFPTWEDFPQNCHNCVYVPIKSQKDWANVDEVLDLAVR